MVINTDLAKRNVNIFRRYYLDRKIVRPLRYPMKADQIMGMAFTGHGASIAYITADGVVRSSVLDRWAGTKDTLMLSADEHFEICNHEGPLERGIYHILATGYGKFPDTKIFEVDFRYWIRWFLRETKVKPNDIKLIVTSESHFITNSLRPGHEELKRWFPQARLYRDIEHHEIHQRQAFWQSGFQEAAVLTLDTCGEDLDRLQGKRLAGTIAIMNNKGECQVIKEFLFPESSSGLLYSLINSHVGFRLGQEGKTMGLAPYGKPELYKELRPYLTLHDDGSFRFLPEKEFQARLDDYVPQRPYGGKIEERHKNVAYAGQALLEDIITNVFKAALRLTGQRNLTYAGGVALNCVANEIACREAKPARLYVAPNPGDTGHALGCALFGAYELAGWPAPQKEVSEYLGPPYTQDEMVAAANSSKYHAVCLDQQVQVMARCIANGYITARFAGQAEFGPRALGNRSILCDPRREDMKDYLNERVKHREAFRPFTPSVLQEQAGAWFALQDDPSTYAYMLRAVQTPAQTRTQIPAVVHVDNTARIQTVSYEQNPGYWQLIDAFYQLTGIPLLLNTSFNIAGRPIVETPQDAVQCFEGTEIDILMIGPMLLSKRPIDEYLNQAR